MSAELRLPLLGERRAALETCGYCPKLCRAACPVSNAEPRDTITPWGKMTISWFAERGMVPVDREHAQVAWACTSCFACKMRCVHRNPVAQTLGDARADFFAVGAAPATALEVVERQPARLRAVEAALEELRALPGVGRSATTALLIGCAYLEHLPREARAAVEVAVALAGSVRLIDGCCGLPLLHAGDRAGFDASRRHLAASLGTARLLVADAGCAESLSDLGAMPLVDLAKAELTALPPIPGAVESARWHDPCQLGRGLGRYDAPRIVLTRLLGRAPHEFDRRREHAACSGAGGILPATMPEHSRRIADDRIAEHERLGGGTIVTACASSLRRFRTRGAEAVDLTSLIAKSLGRR